MSSVYAPENFAGRVALAASYIGAGREGTRTFDTCFEMNDGDAVAVALYRRVQANPDTKLAANIWRYLGRESVEETAARYADIRTADLPNLAAEMRDKRQRAFREMMEARQRAQITTELTPAGEQTVIPGCERNTAPGMRQLDLFG